MQHGVVEGVDSNFSYWLYGRSQQDDEGEAVPSKIPRCSATTGHKADGER